MAKKKKKQQNSEPDSVYFLKILLFFILGTVWIRIVGEADRELSLPVGLIFGILLASHEHFQIDRKIEYAVLLVSAFISFYLPIGLLI